MFLVHKGIMCGDNFDMGIVMLNNVTDKYINMNLHHIHFDFVILQIKVSASLQSV